MKPKVYIETTIPRYLTARLSRDLIKAAHQQITREWWEDRHRFDLYISQAVLIEARGGDPEAAAQRIEALAGIPALHLTPDVETLAIQLVDPGPIPRSKDVDAVHVAMATVHGMDYLLTWNCSHIANAAMRPALELVCRRSDYEPPIICTPIELMEV